MILGIFLNQSAILSSAIFSVFVLKSLYVIQFVCLFVCSFAIRAKNTAQNTTKLSEIIKVGLCECPPRVEIASLAVLEEISYYFPFFVRG